MLNIVKSAFGGKKILATLVLLSLVLALAIPVWAAESTAPITATVTPKIVAVSITDGTVDYGILDFSASDHTNTAAGGTAVETQTIDRSTSNVDVDIALKSSDATGGSITWDLVSTTPVADEFRHQYEIDATATPAWTDLPATNNYTGTVVTLTSGDPSVTLDMQFTMPSSSTDISIHSVTVTVRATGT